MSNVSEQQKVGEDPAVDKVGVVYTLKQDWGYLKKGTQFEVIGRGYTTYPIKTLGITANPCIEVRKIKEMRHLFRRSEPKE